MTVAVFKHLCDLSSWHFLQSEICPQSRTYEAAGSSPFLQALPVACGCQSRASLPRRGWFPCCPALAGTLLCLPAFCSPPSSVQVIVPLGSLRRCCSTCEKSYLLVGSCSRLHIITPKVTVRNWNLFLYSSEVLSFWNVCTLYLQTFFL